MHRPEYTYLGFFVDPAIARRNSRLQRACDTVLCGMVACMIAGIAFFSCIVSSDTVRPLRATFPQFASVGGVR